VNKIYTGDALTVLDDETSLPTDYVDCIITSPPYYNLRDYKTDKQLGQEDCVDKYVNKLCEVFDKSRRTLKKTGVLWVNLGDTYKDKCLQMVPERFAIEMVKRGWILRQEVIWDKPNLQPTSNKDRLWTNHEKLFMFTQRKQYFFKQPRVPQQEVSLRRYFSKNHMDKRCDEGITGQEGYSFAASRQDAFFAKNRDKLKTKDFDYNEMLKGESMLTRPLFSVWNISPSKKKGKKHFASYPEKLIEVPLLSSSPEGGIVMDPFMGSGTTAIVAKNNKRNYVGIEINPEYTSIAEERIKAETKEDIKVKTVSKEKSITYNKSKVR
tara:strand:+ start:623 stop:1591 length:969 start_codon:yes stop_codon:yes gene_type:complete